MVTWQYGNMALDTSNLGLEEMFYNSTQIDWYSSKGCTFKGFFLAKYFFNSDYYSLDSV